MVAREILKQFSIDDVIEIKEIGAGNTSEAMLVMTDAGKYILRKMRDTSQAMTEYAISEALKEYNLSPEILVSRDNQPYVEHDGGIYNLQVYLEHDKKKQDIDFEELGRVVGLYHHKTRDLEGIYEQEDRFSLKDMYDQLLENKSLDSLEQKVELIELVEECLSYKHDNNCYIHGDLGVWNMLFSKEDIYLIDFGEVRRGNNHFDIAAVLASTIVWNKSGQEVLNSLNNFRSGYLEYFYEFNIEVLKESLKLWIVRGILALLINHGINKRTSDYVHSNIYLIKNFRRIES